MDGISLAASLFEIRKELSGAKLEKIQQPERDTLILTFRGKKRLLISCNPGAARIQMSELPTDNPTQAPMFCMLMRKHLQGGVLLSVEQPSFDRIASFSISARGELGDLEVYTLVVEIMGKYSNIILVKQDGTVIDSAQRVTPSMSSVRTVLPGGQYHAPPPQDKKNPLESTKDSIMQALASGVGRCGKWISSTWSGISPSYGKEIAYQMYCDDPDITEWNEAQKNGLATRLAEVFLTYKQGDFQPTLVKDESGHARAVFPFVPANFDQQFLVSYESMGEALDAFYSSRASSLRFQQWNAQIHRVLNNNIERCQKKRMIQQDIIDNAQTLETWKLYGELLTSNSYRLKKGADEAVLENYYEENALCRIPLDPLRGPQENAQQYFKKYNKKKAALALADSQIQSIQKELDYLEGQESNLNNSTTLDELREIRTELQEQGYIRVNKNEKQPKTAKRVETTPLHFTSSTGREIWVGKNNVQNDKMSMRLAKPEEIWLHVKNIPGSHVLIRGEEEPDDQTLYEAGQLAVYYSKARNGSQVEVDFTPRLNLKKPNGAVPGYVIYHRNKSMSITADERLLQKLHQNQS